MKGLITTKEEYTGSGKGREKTKRSGWVLAATFVIPALIVTAILSLPPRG